MKKPKLKDCLSWILVLPGALIAGLVAATFLHLVLYSSLYSGSIVSGVNIEPIEYFLYPSVMAATFILSGYAIAPKHKLKTATAIFLLYLAMWLVTSVVSLFIDIEGLEVEFGWRSVFAILGAIFGLFMAKKLDNKNK